MQPATEPQPTIRRTRVRTNFAASVAGQVIANLANMAVNILLVQHLGQAAHGQFVTVLSMVTIAVVAVTSGLTGSLGIQRIAVASRRSVAETNRHINGITGTSILLALMVGVALAAMAEPIAQWQGQPIATLIRLAAVWPLGYVLLRSAMMIATGLESMPLNALNVLVYHGARVAWLGIAAAGGLGLIAIFIGWAVVIPLAGLLCLITLRPMTRRIGLRVRPAFIGTRQTVVMLSQAFPFLIANASLLLMPAAMQILIGSRMNDSAMVSFFQVAFSLSLMIMMFASPAAMAVYPTISRLYAVGDIATPDHARMMALARGVYVRLMMLGLIFFGMTALLGHWVLVTLFKPVYGAHQPLLLILTASAVCSSLKLLLDRYLFAVNRQKLVAVLESLRYIITLAGSWWVLPAHGLTGAGCVMLIANVAALALRAIVVRNALSVPLMTMTLGGVGLLAGAWTLYSQVGGWAALVLSAAGALLLYTMNRRPMNTSHAATNRK